MGEKKKSDVARLMEYASRYKYFTYCSWILATISAFIALAPFYFIWRIIKEVVEVRTDFSKATHIVSYGWSAVGFTTAANGVFAALVACGFFFTKNGVESEFLYNILFYIIITPILTVTLMKIAYAGESYLYCSTYVFSFGSI